MARRLRSHRARRNLNLCYGNLAFSGCRANYDVPRLHYKEGYKALNSSLIYTAQSKF